MGRDYSGEETLRTVYVEAKSTGSTTSAGEKRHQEGKGLDPRVDPKANGVIRRSKSYKSDEIFPGKIVLFRGTAMLVETRLDSTGSMKSYIDTALRVLPETYKLVGKALKRYDPQIITSIFGDVVDNYILCRSEAEMDVRIAEQMTLMVPEGRGGDDPEDPQFGFFGGAYLTYCEAVELGLKSYDFTITDTDAHDEISLRNLKRVFGEEVIQKCKENGYEIDEHQLPNTEQIAHDLMKRTHAFVLMVNDHSWPIRYWSNIFGPERVVLLPKTSLIPEVEAAIIGLTEGVLELSTLEDFLVENGTNRSDAVAIKRAVAGIPLGAQALLDNFEKIPLKGAIYASKDDLWPIAENEIEEEETTGSSTWD